MDRRCHGKTAQQARQINRHGTGTARQAHPKKISSKVNPDPARVPRADFKRLRVA